MPMSFEFMLFLVILLFVESQRIWMPPPLFEIVLSVTLLFEEWWNQIPSCVLFAMMLLVISLFEQSMSR